jgi:hypothetical protein
MFQNRPNGFVPNLGTPSFTPRALPLARECESSHRSPMAIQITDIYQAAKQRAIEEHEIDKLFNPEFYDHET